MTYHNRIESQILDMLVNYLKELIWRYLKSLNIAPIKCQAICFVRALLRCFYGLFDQRQKEKMSGVLNSHLRLSAPCKNNKNASLDFEVARYFYYDTQVYI